MEIQKINFTKIVCKECGKEIFIPANIEGTYKCSTCGHEGVVKKNEK